MEYERYRSESRPSTAPEASSDQGATGRGEGAPVAQVRRGMAGDAICRADDARSRRAVHFPGDRDLVRGCDHGYEIIA
jgi:hypothetical protein